MAVMTVTKENFQEEVMQAGCPVLLDFWATWCGPCRMVSPIVDEIGAEVTDAKVGKVNVDEQPELAQAFGIASIPTLLVIRDGRTVNRAVGVRSMYFFFKILHSNEKKKTRLHFLRSRFSSSFCDFIMLFSCPFC